MSLSEEDRKAIVSLRIRKAYETLAEAKGIMTIGYWRAAANRLYYACYYVVNALLISKGITAQTHSGVNSMLGLHFVKEGLVSKEMNKFYGRLFELRQTSDYNDWITIGESDVRPLIEPAEQFINEIEKLITTKTI